MSSHAHKQSRRRLKWVATTLLVLAFAYLLVSIIVAYILWHPARQAIHTDPGKYGLPYTNISFASAVDNIPMKGWFIDTPGKRTILVLHGSGSIRDNYINMEMSRVLAQQGYDILLFDFRAHGESGGDTFSLGSRETRDVAGALTYLKTRGVTEVGVLAYSMGAASALIAAPDHPEMRAIVADSSFATLTAMIENEVSRGGVLTSIIRPGVMLVSRLVFGVDPEETRPERAIAELEDRAILLIHASGDTLIPESESHRLYEAGAGNPNLELWVAPGIGHVTAFAENREEYARRVTEFFDKHMGR